MKDNDEYLEAKIATAIAVVIGIAVIGGVIAFSNPIDRNNTPVVLRDYSFYPEEMRKDYDDKGTYYTSIPIPTPTPRYTIHGVKMKPDDNELHCGCINVCTCGDEQADDEIVNNAIREGEAQFARNGNSITPPDFNQEIRDSIKRCVVIYKQQSDISDMYANMIKGVASPIISVDTVKDMRKCIMSELENWRRISKESIKWDMMYVSISDNLTEYRDDITTIAQRHNLIERLYELEWDFDSNKYKDKVKE